MNQIHHHNMVNAGNPDVYKPNLKGIMVGNGVTNWTYDTTPAYIELANAHSFFDPAIYRKMKELKCDYSMMEFNIMPSDDCMDLFNSFGDAISGVNVYDTLGKCYI
jgi:hypothetical protein